MLQCRIIGNLFHQHHEKWAAAFDSVSDIVIGWRRESCDVANSGCRVASGGNKTSGAGRANLGVWRPTFCFPPRVVRLSRVQKDEQLECALQISILVRASVAPLRRTTAVVEAVKGIRFWLCR